MELGASDARTGRLSEAQPESCPPAGQPATLEAFFATRRRREHLRNFLTNQGPVTTCDSSMGSSSAQVAVSTSNDAADPPDSGSDSEYNS